MRKSNGAERASPFTRSGGTTMLKKVGRLAAAVGVVMCGTATAAYAHPGHSTSRHHLAAHGSSPAAAKHRHASTHDEREHAAAPGERIERKASPPGGARANSGKVLKAGMRARVVQEEIDLDEGQGCLRLRCNCTIDSHGNPNCYSNRGDCPNHPGINCIWAQ